MPIKPPRFLGIAPRMSAEQLPDGWAQKAINVHLAGGALAPGLVANPLFSLNDGANLNSELAAADLTAITKPTVPTLNSVARMCNPFNGVAPWLTIRARGYVLYYSGGTFNDNDTINALTTAPGYRAMTITKTVWTPTGLDIHATFPDNPIYTAALQANVEYTFVGPRFQFVFTQDGGGTYGGPNEAISLPGTPNAGSAIFPQGVIPLYYGAAQVQYGSFQVVDYEGPIWDETVTYAESTSHTFVGSGGVTVVFHVNLNYNIPYQRFWYFARTHLNSDGDEGPPSEYSSLITVNPGEIITLNTTLTGYPKQRLYRTERDSDRFLLLDECDNTLTPKWSRGGGTSTDLWVDPVAGIFSTELPPFGNINAVTTEAAGASIMTAFRTGSLLHPGAFGVAFYETNLWLSVPYKLNVWPQEYTIPFKSIQGGSGFAIDAIALAGSTVLVFTTETVSGSKVGSVWAVAGSNPAAMSAYKISDTTPLLNKLSLCKIGQTVYWVTHDGVAASDGGSVRIITEALFTRKEWNTFAGTPSNYTGKTSGQSLFFTYGTAPGDEGKNLRLDLDGNPPVASTFSSLAGTATMTWKSRRYVYDEPVLFNWVRILADTYTGMTLNIYLNGAGTSTPVTGFSSAFKSLMGLAPALVPARQWEFELVISTPTTVREIVFHEVKIFPAGDGVRLTPETVPVWNDVWLKFADRDRFVAGSLAAQLAPSVTSLKLSFKNQAGTEQFAKTVNAGTAFTLSRGTDNPLQDIWRVALTTALDTDLAETVDELILLPRRTIHAENVLRLVNPGGGIARWLHQRYEFDDRVWVKSVVVNCVSGTASVTLNLYKDGAATTSGGYTGTVTSGTPTRITPFQCSSLDLDFNGEDHLVTEVTIYTQAMQPVSEVVRLNDPATWRANMFHFPDRGTFACGSIAATAYSSLTLALYKDGTQVDLAGSGVPSSKSITNGNLFLLRRDIGEGARWDVDVVEGSSAVHGLILMPRTRIQVGGRVLHEIGQDTGIPRWAYARYEFNESVELISMIVKADASVTMRLFKDGKESETVDATQTFANGKEVAISGLGRFSALDFDFNGDDYKVNEVYLFFREVVPVNSAGLDRYYPQKRLGHLARFEDRAEWAGAIVGASHYTNLTLTLSADGAAGVDTAVLDGKFFYLPRTLGTANLWQADVSTTDAAVFDLDRLSLMPRNRVKVEGAVLHVVARDADLPPWATARYTFPDGIEPSSVIVKTRDGTYVALTMNFYRDGATSPTLGKSITSGAEARIETADIGRCNALDINFGANDYKIAEFWVFGRETLPIGATGLIIRNGLVRKHWRRLLAGFKDVGSFVVARVVASDYTGMSLVLRTGGTVRQTVSVTDGNDIKLATTLPNAHEWDIDLAHAGDVNELHLVGRVRRVVENGLVKITQEGEPFSWLGIHLISDRPLDFKRARVNASSYPVTMRLYHSGTLLHTYIVQDAKAFWLPRLHPEREWELDIVAGDTIQVYEAALATSGELLKG